MKDKFTKFSLPLLWIFAFSVIIFMISLTAHAETYDNTLPFKYSGVDNYNSFLTDDLLDTIDNDSLPVYDENYVLILRDIGFVSANPVGYRFYFDLLPINTFTSYSDDIYTTSVPFSIDTTKTKYRFYVGTLFTWNGSELVPYQYGVAGKSTSFTVSYSLFGRAPTTYTTGDTGKKPNWTTAFYYPCYFTKNFYFNTDVVLEYTSGGSTVGTGHATPPASYDDPVVNSGSNHTLPREVPESPTINNYTWNTYNPPSIDTTNLESLLESLIYVINYLAGWLRDNLAGEFQNLISNITNLINYVVETLQYYGGLIISNIQNAIDTFYNNMVSLFEPIASAFSYITTPVDSTVINAAFTSTNFYGVKSQFTSTFNTFDNAFDISEPDSFTIIFNVQNITLFYDFGVRSPVTVDLGANFIPIRQALRTFLWVLVSFGSVFVVEHGLANWLRGERNT